MMMVPKKLPEKERFLAVIVLLSLSGLFVIAVIDSNYRAVFADLAKVAIGAFLGLLVPSRS